MASAKVVTGSFGAAGTLGGKFNLSTSPPGRIAINNSGAGGVPAGTLYVADTGNNRVQRLNPNGGFERAWGFNVSGRDETQTITLSGVNSGASGGTYTLSFGAETTGSIASNATAATVQTTLAALTSVGNGNVTVTGLREGPYTVRFTGALSGTDVFQLGANGAGLLGPSPAIAVATTENGSGGNFSGFEICTIAAKCQDGTNIATSANGGQLGEPEGIAVNQANGHVYVTDTGGRRIEEFDADGNFVRAWGADVIDGGAVGTGNISATTNPKTVTNLKATSKAFVVGQTVTGEGIPAGTTVTAVTTGSSSTLTLSQSATETKTGVTLTAPAISGHVASNERQLVTLSNPISGTFTLTIPARQGFAAETTGSIAFNASANVGAGSVQSSLEAKGGMAGNVEVTGPDGGPYTIQYKGAYADTNMAQLTASSSGFTVGAGSQLNCAGGPTATVSFQWLANGVSLGSANGAQTSTYTVQSGDAGKAIQCQVTAANALGGGASVQTSAANVVPASPVPAPPAPPASVAAPVLSGSLAVGSTPSGVTLTCNAGSWTNSPTAYTYQWYRNGAPIGSATTTAATANVYTVQTADLATAANFQCSITATNGGGGAETKFSANRETSPAPSPASPAATAALTAPAAIVTTAAEGSTAFEVCEAANSCKTAAAAGFNGGQFGTTFRSTATDPAGNVWVADTTNRRFEEFSSTGSFIAAYGFGVNGGSALESCTSTTPGVCRQGTLAPSVEGLPGQFKSFSPFSFAFDSAGNLYAANGGYSNTATNRIERFAAPGFTSVTTFASVPTLYSNGPILALPGGEFLIATSVGAEKQLVRLDSTGAPVETSLAGVGVGDLIGLARNSANGRIYATTNNAQAAVMILEDGTNPPDPSMTVNPITTKTSSTATFTGTVNPQGATITNCSFQYSTSESFSSPTSVPVSGCSSLEPGGGAQPVSVNASGLVPNTKYFVRLAVNRLFIPGTATSGAKSFSTDATTPSVSSVGAVQVGDTSAQLVGTINPNNSGALGYAFQYGTTPALGSSTAPVSVANGNAPVIVSQAVSGLSPGTLYYVKLVATNLSGSASANTTFTTRSVPLPLPDHRAYEMVSPPDKSGGGALSGGKKVLVAENGQAVGYNTTSLFGDPSGVQMFRTAPYVSRRTSSGWQTLAATPSACRSGAAEDAGATLGVGQTVTLSANLDMSALVQPETTVCSIPPLSPTAPLPSENLYRHELGTSSYQLLTPARAFEPGFNSLQPATWGGNPRGFSADFTHVVYDSSGNQAPDAPAPGNFQKVFEWDNGALRLVSKDIANNPFNTSSEVPSESGTDRQGENPVSADGQRIFFQNPISADCSSNPACELYMREDGSKTFDVSQAECTSACGTSKADSFTWASPDGNKALFTSGAKLTDDTNSLSGENLYMFTLGADPATEPHNLTLLSRDAEPADGLKAEVQDVIGASDDGSIVYFVAMGQIVPGAPIAPGPKVYRWSWNGGAPAADYLATLNSGDWPGKRIVDSLNWLEPQAYENSGLPNEGRFAYRRVTPDGRYLLISTVERLDPIADTDATADLYRWSQKDGVVCVTCQSPGVASAGDSIGPGPDLGADAGRRLVAMSADGQRIFFVTGDRLVPQDVNGSVRDVYEWHDGTTSLISSGTASTDSKLIGIGQDGKDVFIYTEQRLVGWDTDNAGDIYDVRVGGGFPEPPPSGAVCEGEACRTAGTGAPGPTTAGTAAFEGPGNASPTQSVKCPKGTRKTVTKAGKTVCKKVSKPKHRRKKHHRAGNGRRAAR